MQKANWQKGGGGLDPFLPKSVITAIARGLLLLCLIIPIVTYFCLIGPFVRASAFFVLFVGSFLGMSEHLTLRHGRTFYKVFSLFFFIYLALPALRLLKAYQLVFLSASYFIFKDDKNYFLTKHIQNSIESSIFSLGNMIGGDNEVISSSSPILVYLLLVQY